MGIFSKIKTLVAEEDEESIEELGEDIWPEIGSNILLRPDCCTAAHVSRIEEIHEDQTAYVGAPIPMHHIPTSPPADEFKVSWQTEDSNFELEAVIVEEVKQPVAMWLLKPLCNPVETRPRAHYRVEANIPVTIKYPGNLTIDAKSKDISEGGMACFVAADVVNPGQRPFELVFGLNQQALSCKARIVRWSDTERKDTREIGIQFLNNPPGLRDTVRAFVFEQQLACNKRRLVQ